MLEVTSNGNKEPIAKVNSHLNAVNLIGYNLYELSQIIIRERDQAKQLRKSTPGAMGQIQLLNANKRANSHIKLNPGSKLDDRTGGAGGPGSVNTGPQGMNTPFLMANVHFVNGNSQYSNYYNQQSQQYRSKNPKISVGITGRLKYVNQGKSVRLFVEPLNHNVQGTLGISNLNNIAGNLSQMHNQI